MVRMRSWFRSLVAAALACLANTALVRTPLRGAKRGAGSSKAYTQGHAVCNSWTHSEIRENRMKPYMDEISGGSVPMDGLFSELDHICALYGGEPMGDVEAYAALHTYMETHRISETPNPFTPSYDRKQVAEVTTILPEPLPRDVRILDYGCGTGGMLSMFHRELGVPSENLHCIELHDSVPPERRADFVLNVLIDPVADLDRLCDGSLRQSFDAVSAFAVFHHIADKAVRANVLSCITSMLKPEGTFLLADWSSYGQAHFEQWFDVAHWVLWMFIGSGPPSTVSSLNIATRYEGLSGYIELAKSAGLSPDNAFTTSASEIDASPLGHFAQAFKRTGFHDSSRVGAVHLKPDNGTGDVKNGTGRITHAMPLG